MSFVRNQMTGKIIQEFKNLTINSLTGESTAGKTYISTYVKTKLTQPWTFFGFGNETKLEINIKETIQIERNKQIPNITFSFLNTSNSSNPTTKISITKSFIEKLLQESKPSIDGRTHIGVSQSPAAIDNIGFALPQLIFGRSEQIIHMYFDTNNRLDEISISEKFLRSESTLFHAKNLRSNEEIEQENKLKNFHPNQSDNDSSQRLNFK